MGYVGEDGVVCVCKQQVYVSGRRKREGGGGGVGVFFFKQKTAYEMIW